jgi:hypothetical protein
MPTADGVLMPPDSDYSVRYSEVKSGQTLESRKGFKIRSAPIGLAKVVENVGRKRRSGCFCALQAGRGVRSDLRRISGGGPHSLHLKPELSIL